MSSSFFFYSGIASTMYTVYAGLRYYALTGKGLVSSRKARQMIESGDIDLVVDVRTKFEWDQGHYQGAKHIPVTSLSPSKFNGVSKSDGILVYCNTGQRARAAAETIRGYGFKNVYYIEGGYWTLSE